jgi:hypothetical protein
MKALVCGGRDWRDTSTIYSALDGAREALRITEIIHGGAPGVDTLAGRWAKDREVPCTVYPANWLVDGKAAGPIRNQRMLDEGKPTMVLAFAGGKGTDDMVKRAITAGVEVYQLSGEWTRKYIA